MKHRLTILLALPLVIFAFAFQRGQVNTDKLICDYLGLTNECIDEGQQSLTTALSLIDLASVSDFYAHHSCEPVWLGEKSRDGFAQATLQLIAQASVDGLNPEKYHYSFLRAELDALSNANTFFPNSDVDELLRFDVTMTDAILALAKDLRYGIFDRSTLKYSWNVDNEEVDLVLLLSEAINNEGIQPYIESQTPSHPQYQKLKAAYGVYKHLAEAHQKTIIPTLETRPELGDSSAAVAALRSLLNFYYPMGEYENDGSKFNPAIYDSTLLEKVQEFQWQHGLKPDGVIGKLTLSALNTSWADRIKQIEVNMERWRWCHRQWPDHHLLINIPAYQLQAYKMDSLSFEQNVVVGSRFNRTPVFQDTITFVDFNPYWNLPFSIASKEILPKLKKNPHYLYHQNMHLFEDGNKVDPYTIDWSQVDRKTFPFKIRQLPGAKNALGRLKFLFPNKYSIYLHDTPSRRPFTETIRAFSHGCVRLKDPIRFAEYAMASSGYNGSKIRKTLDKKENKRVALTEGLPVYLLYFTTWVDSENNLRFQPDVYKRDRIMIERWN